MKARGKWDGVMTIARLNWPFYAVATVVFFVSAWGFMACAASVAKLLYGISFLGAGYFLLGSLWVSHQVYDRSDLYRWGWLDRALLGATRGAFIASYSGFDDSSQSLREQLRDVSWLVLDHFDTKQMTEASIRRARRFYPPAANTVQAPFDQWPVGDASVDGVFGLLSIHELRSESERTAWFAEANRSLKPKGRVVLAEHTRDLANALAFGPGVLHFHSCASWRRCWEQAGFHARDEFRVSRWVRIFVLEPKPNTKPTPATQDSKPPCPVPR